MRIQSEIYTWDHHKVELAIHGSWDLSIEYLANIAEAQPEAKNGRDWPNWPRISKMAMTPDSLKLF